MYDIILQTPGHAPLCLKEAHQKLSLISPTTLLRTVNGDLVNVGNSSAKYRMVIWGETLYPPAFDHLSKDEDMNVHSMQRLFHFSSQPEIKLEREVVPHSILVMTQEKEKLPFVGVSPTTLKVERFPLHGGVYVSYLPIFHMKVLDIRYEASFQNFESRWELTLEET